MKLREDEISYDYSTYEKGDYMKMEFASEQDGGRYLMEFARNLIGEERFGFFSFDLQATLANSLEEFLKRGAKPGEVPGDWIMLDDREKIMRFDSESVISGNCLYEEPKLVGFYGYNGGVLAYVDAFGWMFVGADTEENRKSLEDYGYTKKIGVPITTMHRFSNEKKQKIWEKSKAKALAEGKKREEAEKAEEEAKKTAGDVSNVITEDSPA